MPGDNFSRRVARAAASGGGRTYRAQTPVTWYLVLLVICLLGVSLVAYSRYELIHPVTAAVKPAVPPTAADEWEAAVAVDVCGNFVPTALPLDEAASDPLASLADGVVRVEPGVTAEASAYEGKNASLGAYLLVEGAAISANLLEFPGKPVPVPTTTTTTTTQPKGKKATTTTSSTTSTSSTTTSSTTSTTVAKGKKGKGTTTTSTSSTTTTTTVATKPGPAQDYKNGVTKCGAEPGYISVETWPKPTSTKGTVVPASKANGILFANGELITIAFLPKGEAVPQPPAADRGAVSTFLLEDPSGIAAGAPAPSTTSAPTTSVATTTTTVAKGKSSTTTTVAKSTTTSTTSASTTSST